MAEGAPERVFQNPMEATETFRQGDLSLPNQMPCFFQPNSGQENFSQPILASCESEAQKSLISPHPTKTPHAHMQYQDIPKNSTPTRQFSGGGTHCAHCMLAIASTSPTEALPKAGDSNSVSNIHTYTNPAAHEKQQQSESGTQSTHTSIFE
jgi:hypothetical protein